MKRHTASEATPSPGAWARFWFTPTEPFGLHVVRVGTGLLMIFWLLSLATEAGSFFSLDGWFDRLAHLEASRLAEGPPKPASWSLLYLCGDSAAAFQAAYWGSLLILGLFTLGVAPRITAPLAWLIASSFAANPAFDDEVDSLFAVLTLYLAFGYLLMGPWRRASWAGRLVGSWRPGPSVAANVALRLLQVHLCILIVASGLHKLQSSAWWSGVAHWYLLHSPLEATQAEMARLSSSAQSYLLWLNVMGYATLAWQLAFPSFAWRAGRARLLLLGGCVLGWIGVANVHRMPLFGPVFLVACLAFVRPEEWRVVRDFVRAWAVRTFVRGRAEPSEEMADVAGGRR